jgi:transposase
MSFRDYQQDQPMLLPLSVRDCLSKDHFCFVLNQIADSLDLSTISREYYDKGAPAYHPLAMIKILFYAYTQKIFSSRKIENNLAENVFFKYLSGNVQMDHGTINLFRKKHLTNLPKIFAQIVICAANLGIANLSDISIDGTKIKACASKDQLFTKERLEKLKIKIEEALLESLEVDEQEDREFGNRRGYNQVPENLVDPEARKIAVKEAMRKLDKLNEAEKEIDKKQEQADSKREKDKTNNKCSNLSDKDAAVMKMKDHSQKMAYNCQLSTSNQIIAAYDINNDPADTDSLQSTIEKTEEVTGTKVETVKADASYFSKDNINFLKDNQIDGLIPDKKKSIDERQERNNQVPEFDRKRFKYNEESDEFICPGNKRLTLRSKSKDSVKNYRGTECQNCFKKGQCAKGTARTLRADFGLENMKTEMRAKLNTNAGKRKYDERKTEVEPVIGNIKHNLGFNAFLCRGKRMVSIELGLVCSAHNLIKIFHHLKRRTDQVEQIQWNNLIRSRAIA